MKKFITALFAVSTVLYAGAQDQVKCYSPQQELELQKKYPDRANLEQFEEWMTKELKNDRMKSDRGVVVLPIVFHVLHNGTPVGTDLNISQQLIEAQVQQLNDDFRRTQGTAGFSTNPVSADLEIEFCLASIGPDGNLLAEPGINRIDGEAEGLGSPGYGIGYLDNTVKPLTIWDPERYVNVWVTPINPFFFGILGYAQFPSVSGLAGLGNNEGSGSTDGVVVTTGSVGSIASPNPNSGIGDGGGRTLTHELGHFFGLRHIWGDGGCNADDFCGDTPQSNGANSGCPSNSVRCGSADMVENYMDYTGDACKNTFTQDQKARVDAVLLNSPRRVELLSSNACSGVVTDCSQPYPAVTNLNSVATSSGVQLSWNPIEGSIGCKLRASIQGSGNQQTVSVFGSEPSSYFVPASAIEVGAEYEWQVRCGCSTDPVVAGPWSDESTFSFGNSIFGGLSSELSEMSSLKLYPNPADEYVMLSGTAIVQYSVFDVNGRLVNNQMVGQVEASDFRLDVSDLESGLYLISVLSLDGSTSRQTFVVE